MKVKDVEEKVRVVAFESELFGYKGDAMTEFSLRVAAIGHTLMKNLGVAGQPANLDPETELDPESAALFKELIEWMDGNPKQEEQTA